MTPSPKGLPPPTIIDALPQLEWLAAELVGARRLAVDMESDGFYVYHEKICLLQLSTETEDFVIDPLAVKDLSPLGPIFRDPAVEKVFHAGEYDILCLKRDYGFTIRRVFDTMAASRALGAPKLGLANAIETHFGLRLSKKLQRANWGRRPLSDEQIQYARLDTHFLLRLRDILHAELDKKGLLHDALDEFARLERLEPTPRVFDPEQFWHLPGARELTPDKRAVLRGLFLFRERKAAALDKAPFRVLPEQLLVKLAESCPKTTQSLREARGMTPYLLDHYGREILSEIRAGLSAAPIERPPERPRQRWDNDSMRRYEALRAWRKSQAELRGVNPVVILATEELRALAEAPKASPETGNWLSSLSEHKRETYGKDLLDVLQKPAPVKRRRRRRRSGRGGAENAEEIARE